MHYQTCRLRIDLKYLKESVIIFPIEYNICKNPKNDPENAPDFTPTKLCLNEEEI